MEVSILGESCSIFLDKHVDFDDKSKNHLHTPMWVFTLPTGKSMFKKKSVMM